MLDNQYDPNAGIPGHFIFSRTTLIWLFRVALRSVRVHEKFEEIGIIASFPNDLSQTKFLASSSVVAELS